MLILLKQNPANREMCKQWRFHSHNCGDDDIRAQGASGPSIWGGLLYPSNMALVSAFCREDGCYILSCSMRRGSERIKAFIIKGKGVAFIGPYSHSQERNPHDLITSGWPYLNTLSWD